MLERILDRLADSAELVAAILVGMILVWQRTDSMAIRARLLTLIGSAGLGYVAGGDVARLLDVPEGLSYVSVTVLGPLVLEVAAATIRNPEKLIELVRLWRK